MKWLVLIALIAFLIYVLPSADKSEIVVHEIKKEQCDDQKVEKDKKYQRRWS